MSSRRRRFVPTLSALGLCAALATLTGVAQAAGPPAAVAWTQTIQGGIAGEVDPQAAILTHPNGNVTFGGCSQADPLEAIATWTSGHSLIGSRPTSQSPDPLLCKGSGVTDDQGNIYAITSDSATNQQALMAFKPNGSDLWPAPVSLPACPQASPGAVYLSSPVLGADGNIYGLDVQGGSCPSDIKLVGFNHQTGAVLFDDTLNPAGSAVTSDASAYANGLVVRSANQVSYYDYGGIRIGGPYPVTGEQMDRDQSVAVSTSGRAFVATGNVTTPTSSCPLSFTLDGIEAYQPSGRLWRTAISGCNQSLSINAMPDGGVAMLVWNFATPGAVSGTILRYSATGRLLWLQPVSVPNQILYQEAGIIAVDVNGNVVLLRPYGRLDPSNPSLDGEPEVRVDVYNGLIGTDIYNFDTVDLGNGNGNSYILPMSTIGDAQGRIYLGMHDCPGNDTFCTMPPMLYAINAPGLGIDYPRGAILGAHSSAVRYLALGDSYSSGEGNPPFISKTCDRSLEAWPNLLADSDHQRLLLVANLACSGAKASNALTVSYKGQLPQITAVKALKPSVVTITIGGNDIGFRPAIEACYLASLQGDQKFCVKLLKTTIAKVIPAFGKLVFGYYRKLKADAPPHARVIVIGYPQIFPGRQASVHGCHWLSAAERQEFNVLAGELNSALSVAARTAGVQYAPTLNALRGHELCTKDSWMNAIAHKTLHFNYYAHPNLKGQEALARTVESAGRL